MARASRMSVLKRKRESEKAEKAARKREERDVEKEFGKPKEKESGEASQDDLEAYGLFQPERIRTDQSLARASLYRTSVTTFIRSSDQLERHWSSAVYAGRSPMIVSRSMTRGWGQ